MLNFTSQAFLLPSQVSLNLEALTEAYDSLGPNTDMSIEEVQVTTLTVPSQPRPLSGKESAGSSSGNTPRSEVVIVRNA